jgi:hypothetical protein
MINHGKKANILFPYEKLARMEMAKIESII